MSLLFIGMLGGLVALGAPLLVHMMRNTTFKETDIGSIRFLTEMQKVSYQIKNLVNIPLLLIRLLMITILVLLFSRPAFLIDKPKDVEVTILIDHSLSMSVPGNKNSLWQRALEKARALTKQKSLETKFRFYRFADDVTAMDDLNGLKTPPRGRSDLRMVRHWLEGAMRRGKDKNLEFWILSDFQHTNLPDQAMAELETSLPVKLIPIIQHEPNNFAILSTTMTDRRHEEKGIEFHFDLLAQGDLKKNRSWPLQLTLPGGRKLKKTFFHTGAKSWPVRQFYVKNLNERGLAKLEWLDEDDLYADHHVSIALTPPIGRRALLYNGEPGKTRFENETFYLEKILKITSTQLINWHVKTLPFLPEQLDDYDVIALCNPGDINEEKLKKLSDWNQRGGGLLIFPGDLWSGDMNIKMHKSGLAPANIQSQQVHVPRLVSWWNTSHPALSLFKQDGTHHLENMVLQEAFEVKPDQNAAILAAFDEDRPLIVSRKQKKGIQMLMAQPVDREWSDNPTETLTLPLFRELFEYSARKRELNKTNKRFRLMSDEGKPDWNPEADLLLLEHPSESDLRSTEISEAIRLMGLSKQSQLDEIDSSEMKKGTVEHEIWPWLLIFLLVLALIEMIMGERKNKKLHPVTT